MLINEKSDLLRQISDLRTAAMQNDMDNFHRLAMEIILEHSPELKEHYEMAGESGFMKKQKLKKNFRRKAEAMEELVRIAYPCFRSGNFEPLFTYLPKLGI
jgi:hypothetical protein